MSYEKKMKELLGRLVSMSPEPPPYREEIPMARPDTTKRPRPLLVFLGAAAAVALLAIPVILFTGGDDVPVVAATTTTTTEPETSTTQPATTTTIPASTTITSVPAAQPWTGVVYVYQSPEDSRLGNPALVPMSVLLNGGPEAGEPVTSALAAIGPELAELSPPLFNAVPPDVEIVGISTAASGVLVVDMNEAFLDGAGGLLGDFTMLNQLIYSLTIGEGADQGILFTVNGEPIEAFGSEGLVLTDPVDRQSFISELNPIFLTEPVLELEHVYAVTGLANVFEASLVIQVLDSGEVTHEEPVLASCGTGCWGEFGVGVSSDLITPGESAIRLLTYSAEDGSPQDSITIPIPSNGAWQLTVGS